MASAAESYAFFNLAHSALRRSGIIWTADRLDAFIADSQTFLPGNRMPFAGMPEAADRADRIAYLQQAAR
jgi:cytochrome c2